MDQLQALAMLSSANGVTNSNGLPSRRGSLMSGSGNSLPSGGASSRGVGMGTGLAPASGPGQHPEASQPEMLACSRLLLLSGFVDCDSLVARLACCSPTCSKL